MATAAPAPTAAALKPPPGKTMNPGDPDTLWKWNVLCSTVVMTIVGMLFILRTYVRLWVKRAWILEDWMITISFFGLIIFNGLMGKVMLVGGGVHQWNMTVEQSRTAIYFINIAHIWYSPAAAFCKVAILLLYLRVFCGHAGSKLGMSIRILMILIISFYVSMTMAKIFKCTPREKILDDSIPGSCIDWQKLLNASGIFNISSDILILLIPLKGIWSLQIERKRKIGIYLIFTFGTVAPVFSSLGLWQRVLITSNPDTTYYQPIILLWANAELATAMICVCLPALPGIFQRRKKRGPTTSIINGSSKTPRSTRTRPYHISQRSVTVLDDDKPLNGDFSMELEDGLAGATRAPQGACVTTNVRGGVAANVRGGYDGGDWGFYDDRVDNPNQQRGRIMKVVTVEQSRHVKS